MNTTSHMRRTPRGISFLRSGNRAISLQVAAFLLPPDGPSSSLPRNRATNAHFPLGGALPYSGSARIGSIATV